MTDNLALAIRRAKLVKGIWYAPRPKPAPVPPEVLPPPAEPIAPAVKRPPIDTIQRMVAATYGIELVELLSPRRTQKFVRPRQVAMWLCSKLLPVSLPQIGRRFNRDHTTVLHALRTIEQMRQADLEFEFKLQKMMTDLREIFA